MLAFSIVPMVATTRSKTALGLGSRLQHNMETHPSEAELITSFLRPRVVVSDDSDTPCASFVHDVDVYSAGPGELTGRLAPVLASNGDRAWYFFCAVRAKKSDGQRKARKVHTGEGCWHSEAGAKPVVEGPGRLLVGHRQAFSFMTKVKGRRVRSGWLMVELSLDGADADDVVLCKVYFSPRARASPAAAAAASGRKERKAAADDKNPASSVRRRRDPPSDDAEASTPTPDNDEEGDSAQSRGLADDDNSSTTVADDPDAVGLGTDDSAFSWWMRNRDRLMEKYKIVDRPDEELQKTLNLDEYLRLLSRDLDPADALPRATSYM